MDGTTNRRASETGVGAQDLYSKLGIDTTTKRKKSGHNSETATSDLAPPYPRVPLPPLA